VEFVNENQSYALGVKRLLNLTRDYFCFLNKGRTNITGSYLYNGVFYVVTNSLLPCRFFSPFQYRFCGHGMAEKW